MTIVRGYKATNQNMQCRGHQFEIGVWYEIDGDIALCDRGFHFCLHPSGVWSYYSEPDTRVFEVEADGVLDTPDEPGADLKKVCRRIRLVREFVIDDNCNTGHRNTGDCNTGHRNTGDYNTGDYNTGNCNTGDRNTGDRNTGDRNTGHRNTGDCNTGHCNTGHRNTGDCNTGHCNTGYGNATDSSPGFFCVSEPLVLSFDEPTGMTRREYIIRFYDLMMDLCNNLHRDEPIRFADYSSLPNITPEKLVALHAKHLAAKNK